jgi:MoaA/NifB/PqqE/SkfB family radical SAM enzyme
MTTEMSQACRFRTFGVGDGSRSLREFLKRRLSLTDVEYETIVEYLRTRGEEVRGKETFGIVYDITRICNLQCAHCCVNAIFRRDGGRAKFETTTEEVFTILRRVHSYTSSRRFPNVFLIFGGGEPTLRPDFPEVVQFACELFGQSSVGMNSNGTTLTVEQLKELSASLGFIEISIDGLEPYHNAWRDPKQRSGLPSPYQTTLALVSEAVKDSDLAAKLEVSSVVTTDNISELRQFAENLVQIGVRHYSIHRAMPVGRMGLKFNKIPTMEQYARLCLDIAWLRANTPLRVHLHHSLESIYSVLFLGYDIHASNLLTGSGRHSIGIDPHGNVYFDPWGVVPPFNKLAAGNLLAENATLEGIIEDEGSFIRLADEIVKRELRCRGCSMKCSGGMRFNALAHSLFLRFGRKIYSAEVNDLIAGLSEIDPACPLYEP